MRAILSDIHANLEALDAVLRDIAAQRIPEIWCLGDLIGFGPDPAACVDLARDWSLVVKGDFETHLEMDVSSMNPYASDCVTWERDQLACQQISSEDDRIAWLRSRPLTHTEERALLVHASPRDPIFDYLALEHPSLGIEEARQTRRDLFARIDRVCFVGHTHEPGFFDDEGRSIRASGLPSGTLQLDDRRKYIFNVGSVGQPRDDDYRACYLVWDGDTIRYRRVDYDVRETQRKIVATGVLSRLEAERLTWKRRP